MILLSVGPGPGSLRAPEISRELVAAGHDVEVVLEPRTTFFVGPAAFAGAASVVDTPTTRPEAVVFAPATSGTIARLARGMGGMASLPLDVSTARPIVVAPELDEATAAHPAVRENLTLLRADGIRVVGEGGDMRSPVEIAGALLNGMDGPLSGMKVLITAGGTREPIDGVRVVSNRSSGKMGRAIAREAWRRGAEVTVVAANVEPIEPGVGWVPVETYAELEEATMRLAGESDALVMSAAVSDFTPSEVHEGKIRRGGRKEMDLKLVATGDILAAVRGGNPELFMVGFAATHGDPVPDAREKLARKGVDLVVGNDVSLAGSGFGSDDNEVYIVGPGEELFVPRASKREVAGRILDALAANIGQERVG
ncbi:MAG: Phosphopantothenoylcysteine decarboxylase / Phosphopantothenoylcysteine synthetase [uncultured Rubrobacteraceae bacterium]|uniref:Coenzyme A biosynthesis bifunctional protein CoaBC n=1 Tax=uncultured Rubrobacteraceae bacterium TaxID=349277 RepID=A0A6J4SGD5_9ACTN|nr:MAG: Phosphopantothenoylcysteine decarboxylase / Phosphopantothenoylcysteine synthetase [uncultured Rubrobacteraceae bacterium]